MKKEKILLLPKANSGFENKQKRQKLVEMKKNIKSYGMQNDW